MFFNTDTSLRMIFDAVASAYNEGRPSNPEVMYCDLVDLGALPKTTSSGCLEIGSGCGQATRDLRRYFKQIDCIEPGSAMCTQLRADFGHLPDIEIFESDFETVQLSSQYELIFAGNSLHWIEKELAFHKIKKLLKQGGWLVGAWNLPRLSPAVYSAAEAIISPMFPEFSIPTVGPDHGLRFSEGISDLSTRGFTACQQRAYKLDRLIDAKTMTQLIWSYVSVHQTSLAEREATHTSLRNALQGIPPKELWVQDVFFVGMGQIASAKNG